jgi:hypothetical protein
MFTINAMQQTSLLVRFKMPKEHREMGWLCRNSVGGRMGSERILGKLAGMWIGFDWLRIGTSGEPL